MHKMFIFLQKWNFTFSLTENFLRKEDENVFYISKILAQHHLVHHDCFNCFSKKLSRQFRQKTAFTTTRDHFSRQVADKKKASFHHTHNFSLAVTNLWLKGNPRNTKKSFYSSEKSLALRVPKWSIFGLRPHIRGKHGILMIAFRVNFRYELYCYSLLFSVFHIRKENKIIFICDAVKV